MLCARNIHIKHGTQTVIVDGDCVVPIGSIVWLCGKNGSGKTTVLRSLAGLLPAAGGTFACADSNGGMWRDMKSRLRTHCTLIDHMPYLFPGTVFDECVRFAARGVDRATIDRTLTALGIAALAGRYTGTLSAGETKCVALARAVLSGARVLLCDELLTNLDESAVEKCTAFLSMQKKYGISTLLTAQSRPEQSPDIFCTYVIEQQKITAG